MSRRLAVLLLALAACAAPGRGKPAAGQDAFWSGLRALCGKTFEGRIAAKAGGGPGPDPYEGKRLLIRGAACTPDAVRVDFSAGMDRSRTWVFTRTPEGLRLTHEQRQADGRPDALSGYGGPAASGGTAERQSFPADGPSKTLFAREGIPSSGDNVWTVSLAPGRTLSYAIARPGREFRMEFDLSAPVPAP